MNTELMFSSNTDQWATPQYFFDKLNKEFDLKLDVAADNSNHKCEKYFTKEIDGLTQSWVIPSGVFFAIHHTAERLVYGLKRLMKRACMTSWWLCCSQHELIPDGFMIIS